MALQVEWEDDSRRVIRAQVQGRWTWDDLDVALHDTIGMMDSVDHKVHFIIDIRGSDFKPGSALGRIKDVATPETHRNEGVKVIVGANRIARMLYSAYRQVIQTMGKDQVFHFADSIEKAHVVINAETR